MNSCNFRVTKAPFTGSASDDPSELRPSVCLLSLGSKPTHNLPIKERGVRHVRNMGKRSAPPNNEKVASVIESSMVES
jgi:hypothetical protein